MEFGGPKRILVEFLFGMRERLEGDDFHVSSKVSPEVLAYFEKAAKERRSPEVTKENAAELLLLANEFEVEPLQNLCKAVLEAPG
jgi:hypothetical protein